MAIDWPLGTCVSGGLLCVRVFQIEGEKLLIVHDRFPVHVDVASHETFLVMK